MTMVLLLRADALQQRQGTDGDLAGILDLYFHADHPGKILFAGPATNHWITEDFGRTYTKVWCPKNPLTFHRFAPQALATENLLCRPTCHLSTRHSLQEGVRHVQLFSVLQVDTPGRTLGFWHDFKIHPNRPDWILAKVRRSVCEEWDASTNPWCAYDLFVSQVGLVIGGD